MRDRSINQVVQLHNRILLSLLGLNLLILFSTQKKSRYRLLDNDFL